MRLESPLVSIEYAALIGKRSNRKFSMEYSNSLLFELASSPASKLRKAHSTLPDGSDRLPFLLGHSELGLELETTPWLVRGSRERFYGSVKGFY